MQVLTCKDLPMDIRKYNTKLLKQTDEFGHNINIKYECLTEFK